MNHAQVRGHNCTTNIKYVCDPFHLINPSYNSSEPCNWSFKIGTKLLCENKPNLPKDFNAGLTACVLKNDSNKRMLTDMDKRINKLIEYSKNRFKSNSTATN